MAVFKMGVSVDIHNHQFRHGTQVLAKTGAYDAGTPSPTISITDPTSYLNIIASTGDKLTIGPSTHADNVGAKQELTVSSIASALNSITFTENIIYSFSAGDPITGYGTYFPDAWDVQLSTNTTVTPYNLYRLNNINETEIDNGVDDMYAWKMKTARTASGYSDYKLKQTLSAGSLIPSVIYNLGGFYKIDYWVNKIASICDVIISNTALTNVLITSSNFITGLSGVVTEWTEFSKLASSNSFTQSQLDAMVIMIELYSLSPTSLNYITLWLDSLYLEHAKGTSGAASGVYTFTDYPTAGSQKWKRTSFQRSNTLADGSEKVYNANGRRSSKWEFSCEFENVSDTFLRQLRILEHWQNAGNKLVFHTNEDPNTIHPPVMVGYLDIPSDDQLLWSLSKVSFPMTFREAR